MVMSLSHQVVFDACQQSLQLAQKIGRSDKEMEAVLGILQGKV